MDRRFAKTEKAIRNAYFSLLLAGHKKITVAEIARAADIDRKTFYLHYSSVEEITLAYAREKVDWLLERLNEHGFYSEPYDLSVLFNCVNELMLEDTEIYRCLSKDHSYDYFWNAVREIFKDSFCTLYLPEVDQNSKAFQTYIDFYISGIIAVYHRWLTEEDRMSLEELSDYLSRITTTVINVFLNK